MVTTPGTGEAGLQGLAGEETGEVEGRQRFLVGEVLEDGAQSITSVTIALCRRRSTLGSLGQDRRRLVLNQDLKLPFFPIFPTLHLIYLQRAYCR